MDKTTQPVKLSYHKNFLSQVILKIDFPSVNEINVDSVRELGRLLDGDYLGPQTIEQIGIVVEGSGQELTAHNNTNYLWKIEKSSDKSHFIEITKSSVTIVSTNYTDFEAFKEYASNVFSTAQTHFSFEKINRLGLRYINEIDLGTNDIYEWSGLIADSLTANISFLTDKSLIRRAMQNLQIAQDEDTYVNFNYGVFNKTFPGPLLSKEFILDYECFTPFGVDHNEVLGLLDKYHSVIKAMFEQSIDAGLREEMVK